MLYLTITYYTEICRYLENIVDIHRVGHRNVLIWILWLLLQATFEDGMVEEAIARNHSTTKEAIEVGDSAGAYRIILTHFSQRYPKIPVFDESHMHKTCIAFDLMSVNLADLPVLPKVIPYLKLLFRNEMVVDELDDDQNVGTEAVYN